MTKTIFDIVDPKIYRYIHMCLFCKQPAFRMTSEETPCPLCGKQEFEILPFYDPSRDYGLDVDEYAITMMYALYKKNLHRTIVVFDDFYRKAPFVKPSSDFTGELGGYVAFGGLDQLIDIVENLYFNESDIEYLRSKGMYEEAFLSELRSLRFTGSLQAMKEGQIVFPNTPYIRMIAPIMECIWIEAQLLNTVNSESLLMTKASRIVTAADGQSVIEMGKRRAQGRDASVQGARSAYIAGFDYTSNLKAGKKYGVPTTGTHAHLFVQFFPNELDAFLAFAEVFPAKSILLVDTFDVLGSGIPNAIKVAKRMEEHGQKLTGIRLDSGDLAFLSKRARKILDHAGFPYVKIAASSDLDEHTITSLKHQGAKIDIWGIGTKFITAYDTPALGGVHKIVARRTEKDWVALIKVSENIDKIINPGCKKTYRIYDQDGMAKGDYICLEHENIQGLKEIQLKHPVHPLKMKRVSHFTTVELLVPIFEEGKLVYDKPSLEEIKQFHQAQKNTFWEEYLRLDNPEVYPVTLSDELRELKDKMINEIRELALIES
ncbi:nicotinate phosphoribosyltransferase [Brevibacillus sp. 7WMA2]|uniref:nicotinate phosphoribosyltransferase n=1 Tax=Brevibacillus TaxID=55080 RepID=UPI000EACFDAF|nr:MULTISPECIES: nicotinate phosphoribosyltransferase [Brevibacillus]AYK08073.1 nicotinate phosphoribosyltransferase [Brevibacillus laterosporus]QIC04819.1 nicotinate phosphoribosyltransferase [Brevibacillus sp. 7WMA2]WPS90131.1 nicotinate phosphoribosyltransferase [Brevibacillus halotolerans]